MSKLQYIREKVTIIRKFKKLSLKEKVANAAITNTATLAIADLKKFLRNEIFINSTENKEKHIRNFLFKVFNSKILIDEYSSSKYYPDFFMSKTPDGHITTIARLLVSDQFVFSTTENRFIMESRNPISYENYGLVFGYSTKIENMNKGELLRCKEDTLRILDAKTSYQTFVNPRLDLGLYMGVELEVARKHNSPSDIVYSVLKDLNPNWKDGTSKFSFAILKTDGSLPSHGFEIVSAPATLRYHQTAWDKFFNNSAKHLRSYTVTSCGMHVHISRLGMSNNLHIGKLLNFYNQPYNRKFITDIAGRTENGYTSYKEKKLTHTHIQEYTGDRGQSVNLQPKQTIEIRIFKGNCKKEGFFKNLEFVHASVEFTRQASFSYQTNKSIKDVVQAQTVKKAVDAKVLSKNVKGLSHIEFCTWLEKPENIATYPYLTKWLKSRNTLTSKDIKLVDEKTNDKQFTYDQFLNDVA